MIQKQAKCVCIYLRTFTIYFGVYCSLNNLRLQWYRYIAWYYNGFGLSCISWFRVSNLAFELLFGLSFANFDIFLALVMSIWSKFYFVLQLWVPLFLLYSYMGCTYNLILIIGPKDWLTGKQTNILNWNMCTTETEYRVGCG